MKRWYQFRIADLLLVTTLVAILVALFEPSIQRWLESLRVASAPKRIAGQATLVVEADGTKSLDGLPLSAAELPGALRVAFQQLSSRPKPPHVRLQCAPELPAREAVRMVEAIKLAGFSDISFSLIERHDPPPTK